MSEHVIPTNQNNYHLAVLNIIIAAGISLHHFLQEMSENWGAKFGPEINGFGYKTNIPHEVRRLIDRGCRLTASDRPDLAYACKVVFRLDRIRCDGPVDLCVVPPGKLVVVTSRIVAHIPTGGNTLIALSIHLFLLQVRTFCWYLEMNS